MVDTNINIIQDTKTKIIDLLTPSGWAQHLRLFLKSSDMDTLLERLLKESQEGRRFTPTMKDVFSAFTKCPFDKVKVVIIGQDPYPYYGVADGLAFSCSKEKKPQSSLRYIFKAVEKTVYQGCPTTQDPDLTRWADQGVLLLNSALTCQIDKIGTHYDIWKDFIFNVLDALNYKKASPIPFILMGKEAQSFKPYISHPAIKVSHPASAAYQKASEWDCGDCFNRVNTWLVDQGDKKIEW